MVVPDLEDTRKSVRAGSILPTTALTHPRYRGVEDGKLGASGRGPESPSSASRAPGCCRPCPAERRARIRRAGPRRQSLPGRTPRPSSPSGSESQPRRSVISSGEGFHRVWSPRQIRPTASRPRSLASSSSTMDAQIPSLSMTFIGSPGKTIGAARCLVNLPGARRSFGECRLLRRGAVCLGRGRAGFKPAPTAW